MAIIGWVQTLPPAYQALCGTLFTWGVTALGALVVLLDPMMGKSFRAKFLDICYGFSGGVMLAASYWSLLAPAIDITENNWWGKQAMWERPDGSEITMAWVPVAIGLAAGVLFVVVGDYIVGKYLEGGGNEAVKLANMKQQASWRRVLLLVAAITIHNIPEGLAVGVSFGGSNFYQSVNLAIGIGLQNFPEGMAVALPLRRQGLPVLTCIWYGQLSGMVEPIAGVIGAMAVTAVEPLLPYAMAFAAGAMIFVVVDDLIPESHAQGNGRLSSIGCILGFITMMALDVALG
eukprot:TRINITY_DN7414_c0_g4_i1.p1 TRINITY_DN7414_c0_g4~~TRINITY_DN7414_c0_g4_i1.p1  ORF type:complete len:289 (+),score=18.24 TRINITY_DN7414_c0_g4_i1:51-917(+)